MIALNDQMLDLWIRTLYDLVADIKQVSYFRLDKSCDAMSSAESLPSGLTSDVSLGKAGVISILGMKDNSTSSCDSRPARLDSLYNRALSATQQTFGDLEENSSSKMVTLQEVISMCRKIGLSHKVGQPMRPAAVSGTQETPGSTGGLIEMYFRSIDHDNRGFLDFEQFRAIVKMIKSNPDVASVWNSLCNAGESDGRGICQEVFARWMRKEQGVSTSRSKDFLMVIDIRRVMALLCSLKLLRKRSDASS